MASFEGDRVVKNSDGTFTIKSLPEGVTEMQLYTFFKDEKGMEHTLQGMHFYEVFGQEDAPLSFLEPLSNKAAYTFLMKHLHSRNLSGICDLLSARMDIACLMSKMQSKLVDNPLAFREHMSELLRVISDYVSKIADPPAENIRDHEKVFKKTLESMRVLEKKNPELARKEAETLWGDKADLIWTQILRIFHQKNPTAVQIDLGIDE